MSLPVPGLINFYVFALGRKAAVLRITIRRSMVVTSLLAKRLFSAATSLVLIVGAQGATLLSENFNELTPQADARAVGLFSAIDGTDVDILGPGYYPALCAAPESGNCIDLDGGGFSNPNHGILQSIPLTLSPGVDYFLSFDLIGSQAGNITTSATVTLGSYDQTFTLPSSDITTGIVSNALVTVSSPTSTELTFTSNTPGFVGAKLDDVLITSSAPGPSTTPEPSTLVLSIFGASLMLLSQLSRFKAWRRG